MDFQPTKSRAKSIFSGIFTNPTPTNNSFKHLFDPGQLDNNIDRPVDNHLDERTGRIRDASRKLMDLYNEPSVASDTYTKYLAEQPTSDTVKVSGKRRFGAALAGFGLGLANPEAGTRLASNIVEEPLN